MKNYVRFRHKLPPKTNGYQRNLFAQVRYQIELFIKSHFRIRVISNLSAKAHFAYDDERQCEYFEYTWVVDSTSDKDTEKIIWLE